MDFRKFLEMVAEETTAQKDEKAEAAGKKVAKDIEYDEGHDGSEDDKAEKAGKKVTKDIEYDDKKKSLKEYFEEAEQKILNEAQFPIPVVGPDNKPIAGQSGFLNVSVPGQGGVAVNDLLRRLGARGLSIILPPNRMQQQQQQQALAAAKRAAVQTSGKPVQEETLDEAPTAPFKANDPFDADNNALKAITRNAGLDSKPLAFDPSFDKNLSIGSQPKVTATPAAPAAAAAPAAPNAAPAAPAANPGGMSDEERYGKVGAEIRRLDPEAYKNRPRDYQGNMDLLNKLRAQKGANDKPADTLTPAAPAAGAAASDLGPFPKDSELEPVTVTGKRTQPKDQDKPGDAELGRLLNLAGANTYDELNNYLKTGSTQAPAQPAAAKDDTLDQLQKDVDTVNQEPVDAAGEEPAKSEPAAEPTKADVKTSYQVRDPDTGRVKQVSKDKYDNMVKRGQIDANVPLDYAFKVRNDKGDLETVTYKDDPERWAQIANQNAGQVGDLNAKLAADLGPKEKEPDVKGDGKSLFRKLFNIGKDDQGYYMGKKRGRDNAPDKEPEELAEAKVLEKWAGDAKVKSTGEYKDKTVSQLKSMLAQLKKSGPHKKDSPEAKKQHQINFALRAKGHWQKGEGAAMKEEQLDEKAKNPYAIGMAQAMKSSGDKPPLKKSTITKAHDIAKSIKKKTSEAEIPKSGPDYGAGLGAGRNDKVLEAKPDFLDLDKDGNKKEPMKMAAKDAKKKHKVKESMNHKLKAAYHEGYTHGLRELSCRVKHYEDMEEAKNYFEGYKIGLEECYGLVPGRGYVDEETSQDIVDDMASFGAVDENTNQMAAVPVQKPQAGQVNTSATQPQQQTNVPVKPVPAPAASPTVATGLNVGGVPANKSDGSSNMSNVMQSRANLSQIGQQAAQQPMQEDDMEEGNAFGAAVRKAKADGIQPGEKVTVGGKTYPVKEADVFAFEDLETQLNDLLTESEIVDEGLSVSMSTGQQGSPDSVSVTATDHDSEKLLDFIKQVGIGGLGGEKEMAHGEEPVVTTVASNYGGPAFQGHDMPSMDDLLAKLTGIEAHGDHDHGHDHGEHDSEMVVGTCNECGMMESDCGCEKKNDKEVLEAPQLSEAAPALAALARLAGVAGKGLANVGRYAIANPGRAALVARIARDAWKDKNKDEFAETQTLDQSEYMVAEDDGEGYEQSQADAGKIDSALALSGASKGGATNEDSSFNNTSSYEVDGKPASKAEYDDAMSKFKMPDMPDMPNMPDLPDNTPANVKDMLAGTFKGLGQQMQGIKGKLGSMTGVSKDEPYYKLSQADMDAVLPGVDVTGKRVGGEKLPGDDELGRLLNLAGASTYDELASFLRNRKGNPVPPGDDQLEPVQVTGKRVPVPGTDDELQPVKVTGKRVPVPGDEFAAKNVDTSDLEAQLDAMMKDIMPRMNDRAQDQLDFDQEQSNLTKAAAGDWFRNKIGSGASLNNPRTQDKLNRLRDMKEETTDKMDQDAEKAGKKVAKDIEHDEDHKGKDDNKAEKAGQKVTKDIEYDDKKDREHDKLDEWANDAGKKGTDAQFTRDTNFMTNTIAGGLNKPKSTGQTTIPVIAGQEAREGDEDVAAWKKLAGLEK